MNLKLSILPTALSVCQRKVDSTIPPWIFNLPIWSLTRTESELSLVLPEDSVPPDWKSERNWRAFRVEGSLDFSLTGILASIANPLASAGISIFAISTYDTDMVLVKADQLEKAVQTLRQAGFDFLTPG